MNVADGEAKAGGRVREGLQALRDVMTEAVLGCEAQAELLTIALLAQGHALIEGAPGLGKTSLAKVMAAAIDCTFKRIQFTPDLLPADILGYSVYDQKQAEFRFHRGAVFCNVLLADEINRTTPRVQSALLEAMNEHQVSIDGKTYSLAPPFFVVATQNHLHATGTFPLPESQIDRFLLSFEIQRPDQGTQADILRLHRHGDPTTDIEPVLTRDVLLAAQQEVLAIRLTDDLMNYIAAIIDATHKCGDFALGASARAGLALMRASQAGAFLDGRDAVYPDDVKRLAPGVLGHRLPLKHRVRKSGGSVKHAIQEILSKITVP